MVAASKNPPPQPSAGRPRAKFGQRKKKRGDAEKKKAGSWEGYCLLRGSRVRYGGTGAFKAPSVVAESAAKLLKSRFPSNGSVCGACRESLVAFQDRCSAPLGEHREYLRVVAALFDRDFGTGAGVASVGGGRCGVA